MAAVRSALAALVALNLAATVSGHGAVVFPPPRNAVDKVMPEAWGVTSQKCCCVIPEHALRRALPAWADSFRRWCRGKGGACRVRVWCVPCVHRGLRSGRIPICVTCLTVTDRLLLAAVMDD